MKFNYYVKTGLTLIKKTTKLYTLLFFIFCIFLISCTGQRKSQRLLQLDKSACNKQFVTPYTKDKLPISFHQLSIDTILTNRFSNQSLNIANAIGIVDLLSQFCKSSIEYKTQPTLEKKVNLIEQLQHINQKITLASLEVSALTSELDCEEERANQFAYYLKEKEGKTEKRLIISSIILGAAGTIAGEAMSRNGSNGDVVSGVSIGVSLTGAAIGALMLINKREIEFYHKDNALSDIWENSEVSNYFSPAIWYYLTYESPQKIEKSLAKLLVDKWQIFGQVSNEKNKSNAKKLELYFGNGGKYGADELKNRADMLDQTESYVSLMKQDLKVLTSEIEKLYNK